MYGFEQNKMKIKYNKTSLNLVNTQSISEDKCFFGTPLVYSGVSKTAKKEE